MSYSSVEPGLFKKLKQKIKDQKAKKLEEKLTTRRLIPETTIKSTSSISTTSVSTLAYKEKKKTGLLGKLELNRDKRQGIKNLTAEYLSDPTFTKQAFRDVRDTKSFEKGSIEYKAYEKARKKQGQSTSLSLGERLTKKVGESKWGQKQSSFTKKGGTPRSRVLLFGGKGQQKKETVWQQYRGEVKKYKKEQIRSQPLFSLERKEARKDFRGQLGYKVTRQNPKGEVNIGKLSGKNLLQTSIRGQYKEHFRMKFSPRIPYEKLGKEKFSFKGLAQNIKFAKEIIKGRTNYKGFEKTSAKYKYENLNCMDKHCTPD